jgi:hypothetical protein
MGLWSTLAKIGGIAAAPFTGGASLALPAVLEAGGSMLSAGANASASNRGAQIEAAIEQERLRQQQQRDYRDALVQREQEGRASATDAFKKMQQATYLIHRGDYNPATVTSQGQPMQLASFGFGPRASTETELTGSHALRNEVMQRLQGGNQIPEVQAPTPFTIDPKLLKGSIWEKLAGIAGPALATYGAATNKDRKSK